MFSFHPDEPFFELLCTVVTTAQLNMSLAPCLSFFHTPVLATLRLSIVFLLVAWSSSFVKSSTPEEDLTKCPKGLYGPDGTAYNASASYQVPGFTIQVSVQTHLQIGLTAPLSARQGDLIPSKPLVTTKHSGSIRLTTHTFTPRLCHMSDALSRSRIYLPAR